MASNPSGLKEMVRLVGGTPVMVKLLASNERSGVMVCESLQSLEAALEAILGLGQNIVVQQYLRGQARARPAGHRRRRRGRRGDAPRRARRAARQGSPARRTLRGRRARRAVRPSIAAEAARILRLEVCAVDMLDVDGGPHVFEVNSSPSIREAESVCGVDVAGRIVDRAVALGDTPRRPARAGAPRRRGDQR